MAEVALGEATRRRNRATLCGIAAILGWSVYGVLAVSIVEMPPYLASTIVLFSASAVLHLTNILRGGSVIELLRIPRATLLLGTMGLFCGNTFYLLALASGAEAVPVVIISLSWPVLMVAVIVLAGTGRPGLWDLVALLLGFAGMAAVSMNGASLSFHPGFLIAFLGCLGWAVYSALRPLVPAGPQSSMAMFTLVAGLASIPLHLAFGHPFVLPPHELLAAFAMGALPVGLANLLWDQGARDGDPVLLAGVAFVEPIISTVLIVLILDKAFDNGDVLGLALVLAGIGAAVIGERARRRA